MMIKEVGIGEYRWIARADIPEDERMLNHNCHEISDWAWQVLWFVAMLLLILLFLFNALPSTFPQVSDNDEDEEEDEDNEFGKDDVNDCYDYNPSENM